MKTRLIFLVMLIVCISCGTNNKPVSDAQKEKIMGEVKEVVGIIIKGGEEANFDILSGLFYNSPDFVALFNGNPFTYQQFTDMGKSLFSTLLNQEGTILDEKYMVLDNSTVLFTANSKWLMNFKDGHAVLEDPWAMQYVFKKIDNEWKIISFNESGVEKIVKASDTPKELNQVELMKQFAGKFKGELGTDTIVISEIKSFGIGGLTANQRTLFNGKVLSEETNVWGYDKKSDKYICARIWKDNPEIALMVFWFTSENTCERIPFEFISNPEQATSKAIYEFKSPDLTVKTDIVNGKPVRTYSFTRVK
jgi:hypothetical protein